MVWVSDFESFSFGVLLPLFLSKTTAVVVVETKFIVFPVVYENGLFLILYFAERMDKRWRKRERESSALCSFLHKDQLSAYDGC